MKVLLAIEGGFSKTLFVGEKGEVEWFLKGFQYSRKTNLESPEVIGVLNELMKVPTLVQTRDSLAEWQREESPLSLSRKAKRNQTILLSLSGPLCLSRPSATVFRFNITRIP